MRVAQEVEEPAEQLGRLDPLVGRLLEQAEGRGGIVIGQGLEHRQQPLVAGRPEQRVDDLDRQSRAAGGQQPIQERLRIAQRAAGAAGDDLQGLGLGVDLLLLADLAQRRARSPRA